MGPPLHLNVVHTFIISIAVALWFRAINWLVATLGLTNTAPGRAVINVIPA